MPKARITDIRELDNLIHKEIFVNYGPLQATVRGILKKVIQIEGHPFVGLVFGDGKHGRPLTVEVRYKELEDGKTKIYVHNPDQPWIRPSLIYVKSLRAVDSVDGTPDVIPFTDRMSKVPFFISELLEGGHECYWTSLDHHTVLHSSTIDEYEEIDIPAPKE